MIGAAVGSMALVVVLSVFNGLEELIRASYNTFDPEIKVYQPRAKRFRLPTHSPSLNALSGVSIVTEVIEDNAFVRYQDAQMPVKIKGVSDNFVKQNRLDKAMLYGTWYSKTSSASTLSWAGGCSIVCPLRRLTTFTRCRYTAPDVPHRRVPASIQ